MKRTKYVVHLNDGHVARFSNHQHALAYGRDASRPDLTIIEVHAPDGIIGQFTEGQATREFAHLDVKR